MHVSKDPAQIDKIPVGVHSCTKNRLCKPNKLELLDQEIPSSMYTYTILSYVTFLNLIYYFYDVILIGI